MYIQGRKARYRSGGYFHYKKAVSRPKRFASFGAFLCLFLVASQVLYTVKPVKTSTHAANSSMHIELKSIKEPIEAQNTAIRVRHELESVIQSWVQEQEATGQRWAVAVAGPNLRTGYNQTQPMQLASVYKLFLVNALEATVSPSLWPTLYAVDGKSYQECVYIMLQNSDNDCALAIANRIGWNTVHAHAQATGYAQTAFTVDGITGSAADTAQLLQTFQTGKLLQSKSLELVQDAMRDQSHRRGIPAGCKTCTSIMNKTGEVKNIHNDAATVSVKGKTYSLVVLSENGSWEQIAHITSLIESRLRLL